MIGPSSRYYLRPIISEGRSVNGAILNPYTTDGDRDEGGKIYRVRCSMCHGQTALVTASAAQSPRILARNADWSCTAGSSAVSRHRHAAVGLEEQQIWQSSRSCA